MNRSNSFMSTQHPAGSVLSKWLIVDQNAMFIKTCGCVNLKHRPFFLCRHTFTAANDYLHLPHSSELNAII